MNTTIRRSRCVVPAALAVAAIGAAVAGPLAGGQAAETHDGAEAARVTVKQTALRQDMRKLWEDHIVWTRLAIVSFAADLPDFEATAARLMRNQVDIGNVIKPFYGRAAGNRLTKLLQQHIGGAVVLLEAAKGGDDAAFDAARAAWYANGNQIARFLSKANPRNWPFGSVRALMRGHLDDTVAEAAARLQGDFEADIRAYDRIHRHILMLADTLSNGIVKQFPRRFR